jgi:hypothetical protein
MNVYCTKKPDPKSDPEHEPKPETELSPSPTLRPTQSPKSRLVKDATTLSMLLS